MLGLQRSINLRSISTVNKWTGLANLAVADREEEAVGERAASHGAPLKEAVVGEHAAGQGAPLIEAESLAWVRRTHEEERSTFPALFLPVKAGGL